MEVDEAVPQPRVWFEEGYYEQRARQGAERMDANAPAGWHDQLNENEVDVGSETKCPVGQIFGQYQRGFWQLGLQTAEEAWWCGFYCTTEYARAALNACWREIILERRGEPYFPPKL